jgi:hypothetical protein
MATIHSLNNITLRELDPSLISANNIFSQTKYSYDEFSNGEMLKNVVVPHVPEGILTTPLERRITTGLHFKKWADKNSALYN